MKKLLSIIMLIALPVMSYASSDVVLPVNQLVVAADTKESVPLSGPGMRPVLYTVTCLLNNPAKEKVNVYIDFDEQGWYCTLNGEATGSVLHLKTGTNIYQIHGVLLGANKKMTYLNLDYDNDFIIEKCIAVIQ